MTKSNTIGINELRDIQGQDGNWSNSDYMCGLYNGLELACATLEGRNPVYRSTPGDSIADDITRSYAELRMIYREDKRLSRRFLANPHHDIPMFNRLVNNGAVDLRNNSVSKCLGNGYSVITPIDRTKVFKSSST